MVCDHRDGRKPGGPPPASIIVTFTAEEATAAFGALCYAGAHQRPGRGATNADITPLGIVRRATVLDSARAKLAVALGGS
jgi:hypothetical protein